MAHRGARRAGHRRRPSMRRWLLPLTLATASLAVAVVVRYAWRRHADAVLLSAHERRADSLVAASRLDAAARELRAALAIEPNDAAANRRVALLYAQLAENTQAEYYLSRALAHDARDVEVRERLALAYFASGNTEAAREEADALRDVDPTNATAPRIARAATGRNASADRDWIDSAETRGVSNDADAPERAGMLRVVQRALADQQFDGATAGASRVLARWPDDVEALVLRSDGLAAKADTAGASRDLRRALSNDPTLPGARVRLAAIQLREGAVADARASLQSAAASAGAMYAEPTLALAAFQVRSGSAEPAIAALRTLIAARPRSRRAYEQLGFAQLAAGRPKDALDVFNQLVTLDSTDARGPFDVGLALLAKGRRDDARRSLQKSIDLAPDFLEPTMKLVEMDLADKRPRDAVARIRLALERAPRSVALYGLLSNAYTDAGDAPAAEGALRRAIELDPANDDVRLRLAAVQGAAGRNDAAAASISTVLQSNPKSARALMLSGVAFEQRGDVRQARRAYEEALAIDSTMPAAANNLAMLLMKHGTRADRSRALRLAQTAYRAAPGDPSVADTFGWILYQAALVDQVQPRQTLAAAIELLQQSAKQMPENGEVEYHLGMALRLRGDRAASRAALEAAMNAPSSPAFRDSARVALVASGRR